MSVIDDIHILLGLLKDLNSPSIVAVHVFGSYRISPAYAADLDCIVVRTDEFDYGTASAETATLVCRFFESTKRTLDQTRLTVSELDQSDLLNRVEAVKVWPIETMFISDKSDNDYRKDMNFSSIGT